MKSMQFGGKRPELTEESSVVIGQDVEYAKSCAECLYRGSPCRNPFGMCAIGLAEQNRLEALRVKYSSTANMDAAIEKVADKLMEAM